MGKLFFFIALLFSAMLFSPLLISANENEIEDKIFVITGFEFDITGRTRQDALVRKGEFKRGEEIHGEDNLEKYIADKTQMLINQRVLKDNVVLSCSIGEQQPDGKYPVSVFIKVEDSMNFIVIPMPRYSSNNGLEIIARLRHYNFLGTMNPLVVNLGYHYDENRKSAVNLEVESLTPFKAFGYEWNFKFNNIFSFRPQAEDNKKFFYQNVTGISMELPFKSTTFTFGFEESFNLNEENLNRHQHYGEFQDGFYMASKLYASWEIPTGIEVANYGELTYTPEISAAFIHELPAWELERNIRHGPFLEFSHSFGFEKIDWHGNFRKGFLFMLENSIRYDFYHLHNDKYSTVSSDPISPLSIDYTISGIGHFTITRFFGISSRIQWRHWFYNDPWYYDLAGDAIRGILDKSLTANYMLSLNLNLPLRLPLFSPANWFKNNKLRGLDIEFHIGPTFDIALYHDERTNTSFNPKNIAAGAGFELVIFPLVMRNLYIRVSVAWNISEGLGAKPIIPPGENQEKPVQEVTVMMGHFF